MKTTLFTAFATAALSIAALAADDWTSMFNAKDLTGWKSNEAAEGTPGVFTVKNGELVVSGGRAHLFYVGADGNAKFKNFEFKAKVKTTKNANSGIFFHTLYQDKGWPGVGFECQVNATHSDPKKTGGLYAVADVMDNAPNKDDEWFDYTIKVQGKHVVVSINGKVTTDWTQPDDWAAANGGADKPGRKLGEGTIAIQGHDPKSTIFFKDISIKALP